MEAVYGTINRHLLASPQSFFLFCCIICHPAELPANMVASPLCLSSHGQLNLTDDPTSDTYVLTSWHGTAGLQLNIRSLYRWTHLRGGGQL